MSLFAQIYRRAGRRFAPWKNGGGETAEILCVPESAGFDAFDWRISTAKVAQSGPFSSFPGVQRNLTVIEGGPMVLGFPDGTARELGAQDAPFAFSGAVACDCALLGSELLDLNVMVRAPYRAEVFRGAPESRSASGVTALVFALSDLPEIGLERHDVAVLQEGAEIAALAPHAAQLISIEISAG
ncbi:HutD family protein [Salipiger mangrovisoli]|uniref:HutD family protein n=1 Tax=Salipiger mangrovisoli TaxID=2865933 RepID=A0ABR9WYS3_9RHOB|nr:HutD family protein [Salipiger mangrovisoli]MBE9636395.1 HutD family protein [Salipiger mangrovisoli]